VKKYQSQSLNHKYANGGGIKHKIARLGLGLVSVIFRSKNIFPDPTPSPYTNNRSMFAQSEQGPVDKNTVLSDGYKTPV